MIKSFGRNANLNTAYKWGGLLKNEPSRTSRYSLLLEELEFIMESIGYAARWMEQCNSKHFNFRLDEQLHRDYLMKYN